MGALSSFSEVTPCIDAFIPLSSLSVIDAQVDWLVCWIQISLGALIGLKGGL